MHVYGMKEAPVLAYADEADGDGDHLEERADARLPTSYGDFRIRAFSDLPNDPMPHLALIAEGTDLGGNVLCRVHSECVTGDIFSSLRCDCGDQLAFAMRQISAKGGVLIYLRQEGRGIGLINKLLAYELQDAGADTIEANERLGLPVDARDYGNAVEMLRRLGVRSVRLMTNNPLKVEAFLSSGIKVVERVPIQVPGGPHSERYLATKRDAMGHQLL